MMTPPSIASWNYKKGLHDLLYCLGARAYIPAEESSPVETVQDPEPTAEELPQQAPVTAPPSKSTAHTICDWVQAFPVRCLLPRIRVGTILAAIFSLTAVVAAVTGMMLTERGLSWQTKVLTASFFSLKHQGLRAPTNTSCLHHTVPWARSLRSGQGSLWGSRGGARAMVEPPLYVRADLPFQIPGYPHFFV